MQVEKMSSASKVPSLITKITSRIKSTSNGLVESNGKSPGAVSTAVEIPLGPAAAAEPEPSTSPCGKTVGEQAMPEPKGTPGKRLTILAIDGGGVRGVIPATCLEHLESQLKKLDGPDARIADYFDFVSGTSTGGLIAAMLTYPDSNKRPMFTATDAKQFYIDKASTIFPTPGLFSKVTSFFSPKYTASPLKKLLVENFKDMKIADSLTDLLITSFDVKTQQPVFFHKHVAEQIPRFNASYVDVCLATTAAPTYLPAHHFEVPDGAGKTHQYNLIDGGIAANNPTEVAILHALKDLTIGDSPHRTRIPCYSGYKDLLVLSLGTGYQTVTYDGKDMAGWGKLTWIVNANQQPIIQILQNSSAYLVDYDLSIRFQMDDVEENYLRLETNNIEGKLAEMDNGSRDNIKALENVAKKLLDAQAKYRNVINGELEDKTYLGTNREALNCFAKWLSEERKARTQTNQTPDAVTPLKETSSGVTA